MYKLTVVNSEFRSGLNKILLPLKNKKIGKFIRNVIAKAKRKFKISSYLRRTKTGKTVTVNVGNNVNKTVNKAVDNNVNSNNKITTIKNVADKPKDKKTILTTVISEDKYKALNKKNISPDDLYDIDRYRTLSKNTAGVGKNSAKYKVKKGQGSEYDIRLMNIDISKAPKSTIDKLTKGKSKLDKYDAYKELKEMGILNKKNIKVSRRSRMEAYGDLDVYE